MPLSTSRQQFLAYETNGDPEVIHYNRKGGVFITTCICVSFIISAVLIAVLVGVIVYYITYFKVRKYTMISGSRQTVHPLLMVRDNHDLQTPKIPIVYCYLCGERECSEW